jgi:hypothetical protein
MEDVSVQHTFTIGEKEFLLDGRPLVVRCGKVHYTRVSRVVVEGKQGASRKSNNSRDAEFHGRCWFMWLVYSSL